MIETFDFQPGCMIAGKYEIVSFLGWGWEGEVYKIREKETRIERAAKFFFPQRNKKNRTVATYARKLHKLRSCPILIQYHTVETVTFRKEPVTVFISEYVEGILLRDYVRRFPGRRLPLFQAVHLLHSLADGIEAIHHLGEYHGDLHSENIIVQRLGLTFELKLLDLFHRGRTTGEHRFDDLCSLIRIFYDVLGGQKWYAKQPRAVREICCGLKRSLIRKKFRNVSGLRLFLENRDWSV